MSTSAPARRPLEAARAAAFTPRTLAFLRALERNNRREWFHARKDRYEADVRAPMVALVERLAADFADFAPDLVANPRTSMYRPYRDTRFVDEQGAAQDERRGGVPASPAAEARRGRLLRGDCAAPCLVRRRDVHAVGPGALPGARAHRGRPQAPVGIVGAAAFTRTFGALEGEQLQRTPRGFPPDHPAASVPEVQAVSGRLRAPGRIRHEPGLLPGAARRVQGRWRRSSRS